MCDYYGYIRISTNKQKVDRQTDAFKDWQKQNDVVIAEENFLLIITLAKHSTMKITNF